MTQNKENDTHLIGIPCCSRHFKRGKSNLNAKDKKQQQGQSEQETYSMSYVQGGSLIEPRSASHFKDVAEEHDKHE